MSESEGALVRHEGSASASGGRRDTTLTPGKVFLGGLGPELGEADLKQHFGPFGALTDVVVMKDKMTGNGRGFGFVTFADSAVADRVVAAKHEIKGRSVEAKLAVPRDAEGGPPERKSGYVEPSQRVQKIFVGGLSPDVFDEDLREYFSPFGFITECQVMTDVATKKSRGFGFVGFDRYQIVEEILRKGEHVIKGKTVEVKKAYPKGQDPNRGGKGFAVDSRGGGGYGGRGGDMRGGGGAWGGSADPRMMQQMYQMMQMYQGAGGGYGGGGSSGGGGWGDWGGQDEWSGGGYGGNYGGGGGGGYGGGGGGGGNYGGAGGGYGSGGGGYGGGSGGYGGYGGGGGGYAGGGGYDGYGAGGRGGPDKRYSPSGGGASRHHPYRY